MGSTIVLPNKKQQSGKLFRCQVVNIFSVTGGKLIDCHEFRFGKKIRRHGGKLSKCPVVKKFVDFHILSLHFLMLLFYIYNYLSWKVVLKKQLYMQKIS